MSLENRIKRIEKKLRSSKEFDVVPEVRGEDMTFQESIVDQAWTRSGGRCECTHTNHGHSERCSQELVRERRGAESSYWWQALKKNDSGDDTLSNCEILCQDCSNQK